MLRSICVPAHGTRRPMTDASRPLNSWERGLALEDRGDGAVMPFLNESGGLVGVKEFAETRNLGRWDHPGRQVSS